MEEIMNALALALRTAAGTDREPKAREAAEAMIAAAPVESRDTLRLFVEYHLNAEFRSNLLDYYDARGL